MRWYDASRRELPWRESTVFYQVWLSEIMLQQTRVEAVRAYYLRFLQRFPTLADLAQAAESDVLATWSGLGYYSRARSLHRAARLLAAGSPAQSLPATLEEIRALPGVGPYTAAAIASICFGLPHAAVDGNVIRVVSRLTNDPSESTAPATRLAFSAAAQGLLDPKRPGDFNQAMMELGATVCLPRKPLCAVCPVRQFCAACAEGTQAALPVKLRKQKARDVTLDLVLIERPDEVFLVQRHSAESRLADFWELPAKALFPRIRATMVGEFSHQIVNDRFRVSVWKAATAPARLPAGRWFKPATLIEIPLTTIAKKALATAPRP